MADALTREQYLEKYGKYNLGQLKLLLSNKSINELQREVIQEILDGKETTKPVKEKIVKEPKPAKEPKEPKEKKVREPKEKKVREPKDTDKTNVNEPFHWKEGDVVKFKAAGNSKQSGQMLEGKVVSSWDYEGYKEYKVAIEGAGKVTKRQNTLVKYNEIPA